MYIISFFHGVEAWTAPLVFKTLEEAKSWLFYQDMGSESGVSASICHPLHPQKCGDQWRKRLGVIPDADYYFEDGRWSLVEETEDIPF